MSADDVHVHVRSTTETARRAFPAMASSMRGAVVVTRRCSGAARHAVAASSTCERLHLGKQTGRAALHHAGDAGAGRAQRPPGQQQLLRDSGPRAGRGRPFQTRRSRLWSRSGSSPRAADGRSCGPAFEIQDAVDHVLKDFWACQRTLFVNMTNNKNGHVAILRVLHQTHCAFLDLGRTAGSSSANRTYRPSG